MPSKFLYLLINGGTVIIPFLFSFDRRVRFFKHWRQWAIAIPVTAILFIIWDIWKTRAQVWSFNSHYLIGVYFNVLPLEEVLFFFTIPYACLFIFACLKSYFPKLSLIIPKYIWMVFTLTAASTSLIIREKTYTSVTLLYLSLIFFISIFRNHQLGHLPITYAIHLIPFFIVNGLLTSIPVVIYNEFEIMGFRMGTIPIEDTLYSLALLQTNILIFEFIPPKKY